MHETTKIDLHCLFCCTQVPKIWPFILEFLVWTQYGGINILGCHQCYQFLIHSTDSKIDTDIMTPIIRVKRFPEVTDFCLGYLESSWDKLVSAAVNDRSWQSTRMIRFCKFEVVVLCFTSCEIKNLLSREVWFDTNEDSVCSRSFRNDHFSRHLLRLRRYFCRFAI